MVTIGSEAETITLSDLCTLYELLLLLRECNHSWYWKFSLCDQECDLKKKQERHQQTTRREQRTIKTNKPFISDAVFAHMSCKRDLISM
jgi:hypothetical protein